VPSSITLQDGIINYFFRNQVVTQPSTWFVGLFTDDPGEAGDQNEVAVSGYARQSVTFIAPLSGDSYNSALLNFGTPTTEWGTLTYWGIFTAVSGGAALAYGRLDEDIVTDTDNAVKIGAGALKLSAS